MPFCSVSGCDRIASWRGCCHTHGMQQYRAGVFKAGTRARGTPEQRFWRYVEKTETCWLWTGNMRPNGYGRIQVGGKGSRVEAAHRYSYELHHGPIPSGLVIMHKCDNPPCVNPDHLTVGTYKDNMDDMVAKGRAKRSGPRGGRNPNAKLTEELVRYIRANPERGHKDLADELGLSPNAVRGVRIGRTWKHVT